MVHKCGENIAQMWTKYRTNVESATSQSKGESSFYRTPPSEAAAVGQVITGNIFHAEPEKYFFEPLHLTFKGNTRTLHNLLLNCFCCTKSKRRKNLIFASILYATKEPVGKQDIMGFTDTNLRQREVFWQNRSLPLKCKLR